MYVLYKINQRPLKIKVPDFLRLSERMIFSKVFFLEQQDIYLFNNTSSMAVLEIYRSDVSTVPTEVRTKKKAGRYSPSKVPSKLG